MRDQDADADEDEDRAACELGHPADEPPQGRTDARSRRRDKGGDESDDRRRKEQGQAHRPQAQTHGQGIDARGQGQEQKISSPGRIIFLFLAAVPKEKELPDHLAADEKEQAGRHPMVVGGDVAHDPASGQAAQHGHAELERPEGQGQARGLPDGQALERQAQTHGHGERVHGHGQGDS